VYSQVLTPEYYNYFGEAQYNDNRFLCVFHSGLGAMANVLLRNATTVCRAWQYAIIALCLTFTMQIGALLIAWIVASRTGDGVAIFKRLFMHHVDESEPALLREQKLLEYSQQSSRSIARNLGAAAGIQGAHMGIKY